jgi:hypothetical protein
VKGIRGEAGSADHVFVLVFANGSTKEELRPNGASAGPYVRVLWQVNNKSMSCSNERRPFMLYLIAPSFASHDAFTPWGYVKGWTRSISSLYNP